MVIVLFKISIQNIQVWKFYIYVFEDSKFKITYFSIPAELDQFQLSLQLHQEHRDFYYYLILEDHNPQLLAGAYLSGIGGDIFTNPCGINSGTGGENLSVLW